MSTFPLQRISKKGFILLIIIPLLVRLFVCTTAPQTGADAEQYLQLSQNILHSKLLSFDGTHPTDMRAPFYPFFLAGVFFFSPENLMTVRFTQALLDTLTCIIIFFMLLMLFNSFAIACIGFIISTIHPELFGSTPFILSESLGTFLLTLSMFLLLIAIQRDKKAYAFLAGIVCTIHALCKPVILLFPLFLCIVFVFFPRNRKALTQSLLFLMGFMIALLPWLFRNYYHFHHLIPVSSNFGEALWAGSYEPWDGEYDDGILSVRKEVKKQVNFNNDGYYKVDRYLRNEALASIINNPRNYTKLFFKKLFRFWARVPGQQEYLKRRSLLLSLIRSAHYVLLCTAALGIIILLLKKAWHIPQSVLLLLIVYYSIIHAALMALPRYRIPIIPLVICFASYGIYFILTTFHVCKRDNTSSES